MGVAVRRYIDILIIITFPYTTCISSFLAAFLCSFFKIQAPPAKTMPRSIIVHTSLSLRILHSLEHSHFMGGSLCEYLGISSDVTILCCDASPIGVYWQSILFFDKLVCRIIKKGSVLAIWQPSPKSFLSVSSMLCTNLAA